MVSKCPSVDTSTFLCDTTVYLKIGEPSFGLPDLGTAVFVLGFGGTGVWEESSQSVLPPATANPVLSADVIQSLNDVGYRTVQVFFKFTWWNVDPLSALPGSGGSGVYQEGLARMSCLPATVFRYIYDTYVQSGEAFCGTGNSGGSSQLAYALSHHAAEALFDHVVYTNGPVFADLATGCDDDGTVQLPGWPISTDFNYATSAFTQLDTAWGQASGTGICTKSTGNDPSSCMGGSCLSASTLFVRDTNISTVPLDGQTPDYNYPNTVVEFLSSPDCNCNTIGGCTNPCVGVSPNPPPPFTYSLGNNSFGALASTIKYHDDIQSLESPSSSVWLSVTTVADQEHEMPSRVAGVRAVPDAILRSCIRRH